MSTDPKIIQYYTTTDGKIPFDEWFESLRDTNAQSRILARLNRIKTGNLGDHRAVGEGVCELRIDYGPGYRIYFGQKANTIVLILCGGNKSTQERDIRQAIQYWKNYQE